jgi:hypothetical protein
MADRHSLTPELIARDIVERAALLRPFDPLKMMPPGVDPDVKRRALDLVARDSSEFEWDGELWWRLEPEARRDVLARLVRERSLRSVLKRVKPEPGDRFAGYLRDALDRRSANPKMVSAEDQDLATTAFAVAAEVLSGEAGADAQQTLGTFRSLQAERAERERYRTILPRRLFGRRQECAALRKYVRDGKPSAADELPAPATPAVPVRPYLITGVAGSGKSALLAQLVWAWRGANFTKMPVVVLDFDRPAIAVGDELEWTLETGRQLGLGRPDFDRQFGEMRARVRASQTTTLEASATSVSVLNYAMRNGLIDVLGSNPLLGSTLIVVIDTFEEVLVRSDITSSDNAVIYSLFGRLLAWAAGLGSLRPDKPIFGAVRIIVSGRTKPELDDATLGCWFCGHRDIGDLDTQAAAEFLLSRDERRRFGQKRAKRAVGAVGGHPLTLILLERFARNATISDIDDLIAADTRDPAGGKALSRNVLSSDEAVRSLYARILDRLHVQPTQDGISGATLSAVASPGLVMRRIDVNILTQVIGPACGLDSLEPHTAEALLARLKRQVWLVEAVPGAVPPAVRHRPDIRRLMLPAILREERETHSARAVVDKAIEFFAARKNDQEAEAEEGYYRALRGHTGDVGWLTPKPSLCGKIATSAGEDIAVMPIATRALLRVALLGPDRLSQEEIAALPVEQRDEARVTQSRSSRRHGGVPAPKAQVDARKGRSVRSGARQAPGRPRGFYDLVRDRGLAENVTTLFMDVSFKRAATLMWKMIVPSLSDSDLSAPLPVNDDPVGHFLWQGALARLAAVGAPPSRKMLISIVRNLARRPEAEKFAVDSAGAFVAAAATLAAGGNLPEQIRKTIVPLGSAMRHVSYLKTAADVRVFALRRNWLPKGAYWNEKIQVPAAQLRLFSHNARGLLKYNSLDSSLAWLKNVFNKRLGSNTLERMLASAAHISVKDGFFENSTGTQLPPIVPEFHDAVIQAITTEFSAEALRRRGWPAADTEIRALEALRTKAAVWPSDLELRRNKPLNRAELAQMIVHLDRCGLLRDFILLLSSDIRSKRLQALAGLMQRYEAALLPRNTSVKRKR